MSIVSGIRSSIRSTIRSGLNPSLSGPVLVGVAQDTTSSMYVPANATQWTTVRTAAGIASGNPASLYLMQEAAGNPADSIGATALTASGTGLAYQQSVAGWTRKAITLTEAATNTLSRTIGAGNVTSFGLLLYVAVTATPAVKRSIIEHPNVFAEATPAGVFAVNGGSLATGSAPIGTTVHPLLLKSDITGSALKLYSDGEIMTPTFFSAAGTTMNIGSATSAGVPMAVLYAALFTGAAAELSDASVRNLFTTLGWSVAW